MSYYTYEKEVVEGKDYYWTIGNGGHCMVVEHGLVLPKSIDHTAAKKGLFNMLPFIMRRVDNDLTSEEKSNYGPSTVLNVGGTSYVSYYLKNVKDGVHKTLPFQDEESVDEKVLEFHISDVERLEFIHVCRLLYNDPNHCIISEYGVVRRDAFKDGYQEKVVKASMRWRHPVFQYMREKCDWTLMLAV